MRGGKNGTNILQEARSLVAKNTLLDGLGLSSGSLLRSWGSLSSGSLSGSLWSIRDNGLNSGGRVDDGSNDNRLVDLGDVRHDG